MNRKVDGNKVDSSVDEIEQVNGICLDQKS